MNSENQVKRLTVDDIAVPEGMLDAYVQAGLRAGFQITLGQMDRRRKCFAAALLWLAENPIVPSEEDTSFLYNLRRDPQVEDHCDPTMATAMIEWQRRMFLRKPAALPEEVKSLLFEHGVFTSPQSCNERIIASWKLGKEGK